MLTGDNQLTAQAVGREVGLQGRNIKANMLPLEKADFISKLKQEDGSTLAHCSDVTDRRADRPS
jgi:cation transport ATPase